GSSISFVLEYEGVALLLTGDAHARSLASSLERLAKQRAVAKLPFDAVKLPHHGSMSNISEAWLQWIDCQRWLISTNGAVFDHPDVATAQLIARHYQNQRPTLLCNYKSPSTERLTTQAESATWRTVFPEEGKSQGEGGGLLLRWPASTSEDACASQPSRPQRQRGQKPTTPGKGQGKANTRRVRRNASGKTGIPRKTGGTR